MFNAPQQANSFPMPTSRLSPVEPFGPSRNQVSALHSFHTRGPSAASEDLATSEKSDSHETIEKRHVPLIRSWQRFKRLPLACHGHVIEEIPNRRRRLIVIKIPFVFLPSQNKQGRRVYSITHRPHIGTPPPLNEVPTVVEVHTALVAAFPSLPYSAIPVQCFDGREATYQS